ncbi:MAG: cell division protein ZipA C-terminal FtsZ-binding domain-containing protein [Lautropia sp.]|nr:cell division protein ZipA C-terminal FtsZ-binding domain-containing protein [Lautropia sp.]
MSTLSLSIIALIVVVLVIVIVHNLWQAHRRNRQDLVASLRKGRFDPDPDTLTGTPIPGGAANLPESGRDRREPVMADDGRQRIPPSLAARPAQVEPYADDEAAPDALRAARGEGSHPSLALDDEDFIETPFENPAAVRPWSSSDKPGTVSAAASGQGVSGAVYAADDRRSGGDDRDRHASSRMGEGRSEAGPDGSVSSGSGVLPPARPARHEDASARMAGAQAGAIAQAAHARMVDAESAEQGGHTGQGAKYAHSTPSLHGQSSDAYDQADSHLDVQADHHATPQVRPERPDGEQDPYEARSAGAESDRPGQAARDGEETADAQAHSWPVAQVEHSIILEPPAPVNTDRLIALTSSLRHVGSKPVRIEVERLGGHWATLAAGDKAVRMRCSLLLANRQGPLNAVELSDFNAAIEALAVQLQSPCEIADMAPILRQARDLDALAARLDTQIEIMVELSEPADPGRLVALARQHGLSERGNGRYEAFADSGDSLFTLALTRNRDQINFLLDVPRTAERHEAWQGMVGCASSFAQALGGRLIDSSGRGLSVGMIETVSRQLARRYLELAQSGLTAGQPGTLRVFH